MERFEIIGSRTSDRYLQVDIAYKNTPKEFKALDALLGKISGATGNKKAALGADDAQRYAFNKLLTQMLRFADEGNFAEAVPEKDRYQKLRRLANSVNGQMMSILQEHRRRKVMTLSFNRPSDPEAVLKAIHKVLRNG